MHGHKLVTGLIELMYLLFQKTFNHAVYWTSVTWKFCCCSFTEYVLIPKVIYPVDIVTAFICQQDFTAFTGVFWSDVVVKLPQHCC